MSVMHQDGERGLPPARPRTRTVAPASTANYEVGYKKPPVHSRFKPGKSGNPKGRAKKAKSFKTLVREAMIEPVKVRTARGERTVTRAQAAILKVVEKATKGDLRALERLLIWYQQCVPDEPQADAVGAVDFTQTDEATLQALTAMIASDVLLRKEPGQ